MPKYSNHGILVRELLTDPLGRGYAAMSDSQAADDMSTISRTVAVSPGSISELFDTINLLELNALNPVDSARLDRIIQVAQGRVTAHMIEELVLIFGVGSQTEKTFNRSVPISRADELGAGLVTSDHIHHARVD